ncbi:hypothetical protein ACFOWZ_36930 [Lentzea rhizosphaerae]|uniref:MYXO-CTERM domain-containing protein n=1 Tax=Lentzea rhizosphaerae TaxID=2041025 RepID=A0ABV8C4Z3_9PSEU
MAPQAAGEGRAGPQRASNAHLMIANPLAEGAFPTSVAKGSKDMARKSRSQRRQNEALYPAKVTAGWISVALLCGMLWTAIERGPNQAYIALVAAVTAVVVVGLLVYMRRHSRDRR